MFRKIFFVVALLCAAAFPAFAEISEPDGTDANLVGHILDKNTGEHLPFISVVLQGTMLGTTSDASGHFYLKNLPEGEFILEISAIGYKTIARPITLKKGRTLELNFHLEEEAIALGGVVVTASRSETLRQLAPTLVNVVDAKVFSQTNSVNLAQGIAFQPGIRVETNCQNCGFQQIRINGLDGPYTQILIDSRPVFSALAGVYGIEQIPASMVERVEVMRGGGSALFGSSAIAGTINIITKEPVRNFGEVGHGMTVLGNGTMDHNTSLNASFVTDDNKAGLFLFGQSRDRGGYDANGDGFTELAELQGQTLGLRSYVKTGVYSKLSFEYHHMNEYRRGGDSLGRPPHEANIAEQIRHNINAGSVKFDYFSPNTKHRLSVFGSAQHIARESYYGGGQDLNAYGSTRGMTWVGGAQYIYKMDDCLFMPADLTVGTEIIGDYLNDTMWGYNRYTEQEVFTESIFAQNEWKNRRWSFLIGGRLDKNSLLRNPIFSPRLNVRFNPSEKVNLRASYSSGYRAPQVFDEDLHVANVGGTVLMIRNSADLREERSHSFTLSGDLYHQFGDWQANLLLEGFYTHLVDVFELGPAVVENGVLVQERLNGPGAWVAGVTLETKVAYRDWFQLQAGLTWQQSRYDELYEWSETAPAVWEMFRTPDWYGYFTASAQLTEAWQVALNGTYTGSMLVQHMAGAIPEDVAEVTPDFFDLGAKVSYDLKFWETMNLQFNLGVQNIFNAYQQDFDEGADRDSGYMYGPSLPRNFYLGLRLMF
ncbi:MAG: TonB-dependent receptor [Bacteroidales bacterium]|nr:TonB-dependent receptor [Bacteroidales bacterium]